METNFRDFLKRCIDYGLTKLNTETALANVEHYPSEVAALVAMSKQRNTKIEQYRIKKELDDQIKQIKIVMERDHMDDDIKRDFYIKLIKSSIMNSIDEIASVDQEKQILDHMAKFKHENPDFEQAKPVRRPTQPLKPIIITKDAVQKAVYGLGYPSLPTFTVDEFYTQRVKDGVFPDPSVVRDPNSLQSKAMRGETTELDEQEEIKKVCSIIVFGSDAKAIIDSPSFRFCSSDEIWVKHNFCIKCKLSSDFSSPKMGRPLFLCCMIKCYNEHSLMSPNNIIMLCRF